MTDPGSGLVCAMGEGVKTAATHSRRSVGHRRTVEQGQLTVGAEGVVGDITIGGAQVAAQGLLAGPTPMAH